VSERIHFISHQKKQILMVDFSNCQPAEVEKIARGVPDYVSTQPRGSVLALSDFTGASLDQDAIRTLKESAVFDRQIRFGRRRESHRSIGAESKGLLSA
jgi:hypothetical protein